MLKYKNGEVRQLNSYAQTYKTDFTLIRRSKTLDIELVVSCHRLAPLSQEFQSNLRLHEDPLSSFQNSTEFDSSFGKLG